MLDLQGFLVQTITSTAITAVLVAALAWLTRSLLTVRLKNAIAHEYATKLETYKGQIQGEANLALEKAKAQLQADTGMVLERAKAELSLASKKSELRFARMHDKRAEVIGKTFEKLKTVHMAMVAYTAQFEYSGIAPREVRRERAAEAYNQFHDYVETTAIYLPKATADRIVLIDNELRIAFNRFALGVDSQKQMTDQAFKAWVEIAEKLDNPIKEILESIADEFRNLIGAGEA